MALPSRETLLRYGLTAGEVDVLFAPPAVEPCAAPPTEEQIAAPIASVWRSITERVPDPDALRRRRSAAAVQ